MTLAALSVVACLLASWALVAADDPLEGPAGPRTYLAAVVVAAAAMHFCVRLACPA